MTDPKSYPAQLSIDYSEKLDRLTSFFRVFVAIPIWIILILLVGMAWNSASDNGANWSYSGFGIVVLPLILMILFKKKYPRWWYDWNLNFTKFSTRVGAYFLLLTDKYPSTDEEQLVHIDIPYPDSQKDLKRGMPLVKWFLAIPHWIVLAFLGIATYIVTIIAWFAILFTGRFPRGLFDFVLGVMRWGFRVMCYAMIMITDKYPPFALDT